MKVLMIEDDDSIVDIVSLAFKMRLPEATLTPTSLGQRGLDLMKAESPDVIILDLGLPDMDGFRVLQEVRLSSSVPVLIATVRGADRDIVRGLELGADDYVVKPFRPFELFGRVKALTSRPATAGKGSPLVCGSLYFDPSTRMLLQEGKHVPITATEAEILTQLMTNAGRVVTNAVLARAVWGQDYAGAAESLKSHINRLLGRIEANRDRPQIIVAEPDVGYRMVEPARP